MNNKKLGGEAGVLADGGKGETTGAEEAVFHAEGSGGAPFRREAGKDSRLAGIADAEKALSAGGERGGKAEGEKAHRVAEIDFDAGLHERPAVGILVHHHVHAEGTLVLALEQQGEDFRQRPADAVQQGDDAERCVCSGWFPKSAKWSLLLLKTKPRRSFWKTS